MSSFPCLVRFVSGSGQVRHRLGDRLVDRYVESAAEPERDPMREDRMPGDQVLSPVTAGGPTSA